MPTTCAPKGCSIALGARQSPAIDWTTRRTPREADLGEAVRGHAADHGVAPARATGEVSYLGLTWVSFHRSPGVSVAGRMLPFAMAIVSLTSSAVRARFEVLMSLRRRRTNARYHIPLLIAASILEIGTGPLTGVVMAAYQLQVVGVIVATSVQRDAMVDGKGA